MEKVGFGLFGRPVDHKYVSNGLFRSLQLEGETYLDLPNNINLAKGERIIKISRQAYDSNMYEVIKIYIYDYAESFIYNEGGRGKGFVGSAYVFIGDPTQKLLYNAVKHLHPKVLKLLNENEKFKDRNFNVNVNELISPAENGLVTGNPQKINSQLNTGLYAVHTDGPVLEYLISVVQGFMYNTNFRTLKTLYVSDDKKLLKSIVLDDRRIYGVGHLLNYQNNFRDLNNRLSQKQAELQQLQKRIEEEKRKRGEEIEAHIRVKKAKLEGVGQNINAKNQELKRLQSEIDQSYKKYTNLKEGNIRDKEISDKLQNQIIQLKEVYRNLETKINSLKAERYNSFEKLLEDKRFQSEKEKYLTNNSEIGNLKNKVARLEEEKKEREENKASVNRKLVVLSVIILFFLILGYSTGTFLPPNKIKSKIASYFKQNTEKKDDVVYSSEDFSYDLKEYNAHDFYTLIKEDQQKHKLKMDNVLSFIESGVVPKENKDLQGFFERKWNFAEVLDYDKMSINTKRYDRIKKIYNTYDKTHDFFDKHLMLQELNSVEYIADTVEFNTNDRNKILRAYLEMEGNVYSHLPDLVDVDESYIYEDKNPLFYSHFRWMVKKLSEHTGDQGDLRLTGATKHIVPIKKQP